MFIGDCLMSRRIPACEDMELIENVTHVVAIYQIQLCILGKKESYHYHKTGRLHLKMQEKLI